MTHSFHRAILAVLVAAPVAQGTNFPRKPIDPPEAAALRERSDPSLGSMRAGQVSERPGFDDSERTKLRAAEAASPELAQMRAGTDWDTVIVTVLIVLLILILL